jgi:hypothetical protein
MAGQEGSDQIDFEHAPPGVGTQLPGNGIPTRDAGIIDEDVDLSRYPLGRAVALSIPTPSSRFERQKAVLGKKILAARKRITDALGISPPA